MGEMCGAVWRWSDGEMCGGAGETCGGAGEGETCGVQDDSEVPDQT